MTGAGATLRCSAGHDSTDADYCSVCGIRLGVDPSSPPPPPPPPAAAATSTAPAEMCPHCATALAPDSRFCEVCGYDPATGDLPDPPVVQPADPLAPTSVPADADADADADDLDATPATGTPAVPDGSGGPTVPGAAARGTWLVVVSADRPYYDRNQVTEVQFPVGVPGRTIILGDDQASIGRRSRSRGTSPTIDLTGPPEDSAVSHTHASLLPRDDGGWDLVDHSSTNGTYLNESSDPVPPNTPQPLAPGDSVYVGAWTKITLEVQPEDTP